MVMGIVVVLSKFVCVAFGLSWHFPGNHCPGQQAEKKNDFCAMYPSKEVHVARFSKWVSTPAHITPKFQFYPMAFWALLCTLLQERLSQGGQLSCPELCQPCHAVHFTGVLWRSSRSPATALFNGSSSPTHTRSLPAFSMLLLPTQSY